MVQRDGLIVQNGPTMGTYQANSALKQMTIQWNDVAGAQSYEVFVWNMTAGSLLTHQKQITSESWTSATGLRTGSYRVWVIAVGSNGFRSLWSNPLDIQIA